MLSVLILSALPMVCMISGQVTWSETQTMADLKTTCPIEYHVKGRVLLLKSHRWLVEVAIPEEPGTQSFVYRWGQADARVGDHIVPISYGPVGGA
jgi:hypothetical protein